MMDNEQAALEADMQLRMVPSAFQRAVADAIFAKGLAVEVIVPVAFPGKSRGFWTLATKVEHPAGFWPVRDDEEHGAMRVVAEAAADAYLGQAEGVAGWISLFPNGEFAAFEGYRG